MTGHRPRKRFGQHFLHERHYIDAIVRAVDPARADRMVEIGPGEGALTGPLLEHIECLHAVELDRDLAAQLRERFPAERLVLHQADALAFDFAALGPGLRVVGNLPYNISTPLLFHIAHSASALRDCHFMLQREVVERMVAEPDTPAYGRLSVMLQYRFGMEKLFIVPPGAFRPPPQVDSAVVRLRPFEVLPCPAASEQVFAQVVAAAFSQRRKMLRTALRGLIEAAALQELGIEPTLRGETLPVCDFVRIADRIAGMRAGA